MFAERPEAWNGPSSQYATRASDFSSRLSPDLRELGRLGPDGEIVVATLPRPRFAHLFSPIADSVTNVQVIFMGFDQGECWNGLLEKYVSIRGENYGNRLHH